MDKSSQQGLRPLKACSDPDLSELMVDLGSTLAGNGPALGFGRIESTHVPEQIALVTSTTGSTGRAKEVGLSASALLLSARASNLYLDATYGQVWSLLLPLTHIAGVNVLVRSLELGTSPIDLRAARGRMRFGRADFTAIVPTQLFRALNGDTQLLQHLKDCRAVLVGGDALAHSISSEAMRVGINIVQTYGMSETCGGCVYNGEPLQGVEVKIMNGQVAIKSPTLATTYINNESRWLERFKDGWFLTSDQGVITDGKLQILGRVDDVIISGGENISLNTMEEFLKSHCAGVDFAAFAVPDQEWGSSLHIAMAPGAFISDEEIASLLVQTFGEAAKPKGFHRLSALPLMGIGKVDRNALVQLAERLGK
ncbi:MAG: AMP-binding protein [Actinobacteria bacterium]|nr:AMP-binding protein [Actinomycetota bacterium]